MNIAKKILHSIQKILHFLLSPLIKRKPILDKNFLIVEILDKKTNKCKPGILLLEIPFKNVLILIENDGSCAVINSPRFLNKDEEWNILLQKTVNEILKSL